MICNRHGPTLQYLAIKPYEDYYDLAGPPYVLQAEDIEQFAQTCPNLTALDIRIKRTKGDNRETRCYEALGKLDKLKTAKLFLDCSNDAQHYQNPSVSILEQALINSALDETLAQSIWDAAATPSLQTLIIANGGGSSFGNSHPGDLSTIVNNMSRRYKLERVHGKVEIVELSRTSREHRDQFQREHEQVMLDKWGHRGLTGSAFDAMDKLWVLEADRANWREAWRSFPLQRSC